MEALTMQKQPIFEARKNGVFHYRIPTLLKTKHAVLAFGEARTGRTDWDKSAIVMRRSLDDGMTFDEPRVIAESAQGQAVHNLVAIADGERTHFLYCSNYDKCFYMRSDDDGTTFSAPRDITAVFEGYKAEYDWKVIATGPGHSIRLTDGRLVVPVWMSTGDAEGDTSGHRPSIIASIYSDDGGDTWLAGSQLAHEIVNPNETGAVELSDGSVLFNIRNEDRPTDARRAYAVSKDGASNWSAAQFDEALLEPICFASILRHPKDNLILFANPNTLDGEHPHKLRKNLSIRASRDDCKTWSPPMVIEAGISGYSDLAAADDGSILCLYESGGFEGNSYDNEAIVLARILPDWMG